MLAYTSGHDVIVARDYAETLDYLHETKVMVAIKSWSPWYMRLNGFMLWRKIEGPGMDTKYVFMDSEDNTILIQLPDIHLIQREVDHFVIQLKVAPVVNPFEYKEDNNV